MKIRFFALLLVLALFLGACGTSPAQDGTAANEQNHAHTDEDNNGICDQCALPVEVIIDFYSINDLHGKIADADTHPGVDEMTTYLRNSRQTDDHVILLSAGDMWQGSAESNTTQGNITTDWMNAVGFDAMAMGNHEYDWGEAPIEGNDAIAQFPFLAINVYDRQTRERVSYCDSSVLLERGGVQIGVIGAIGDCYSSISADKVEDVYFLTGEDLTELVMEESEKLRTQGADMVVYVLHDGYSGSSGASAKQVTAADLSSYYDTDLSQGYVDLVFEGHTHQRYVLEDPYGVFHIQNGGDNKGLSHVEVGINTVTGRIHVRQKQLIAASTYVRLEDDPVVETLLAKYDEQLSQTMRVVGNNTTNRNGDTMRQLVAQLYYQKGMQLWGDDYDIVLGGGFISIRDPGYLGKGAVTYAMLQALFPFDNQLVLCSVKGQDLLDKFFESTHYAYYIHYEAYGTQVYKNIDPNATYYIVVDTYTSTYAPNRLTEVARYEEKVYARDLLAEYIGTGAFS